MNPNSLGALVRTCAYTRVTVRGTVACARDKEHAAAEIAIKVETLPACCNSLDISPSLLLLTVLVDS